MEAQERICTLCLQICDNLEPIEGYMKGALNILLPKLDLSAILKPETCTNCKEMLLACSDFKAKCFNTLDRIVPYINKDNDKLDLRQVYLSESDNCIGVTRDHEICGFCMSPVENCGAIFLDVEQGDVKLKNMMEQCLPELDLSIIERPIICAHCHGSLENCFSFITNCLTAEEKIEKYRDTLNPNGNEQIELSGLLKLTVRDLTVIEERHNLEERQMSGEGCGETAKTIKDEDDLKSCNEEESTSTYTLKREDEIEIEEVFYGKNKLKEENIEMTNTKFILDEDIEIKREETDFNRFEDGIILQQPETGSDRNQNIKYKRCPKKPREHKDPLLEVPMYKCDSCLYQTKRKYLLRMHLLTHKDPSELTMYKCNSCLYQAKRKDMLKIHLLKHKDPSEVPMYKCDNCLYQTRDKRNINKHLLIHKDPSEVTMYKCDTCLFQTKHKYILKLHSRKHTDTHTYKCNSCPYQTKLERCLKIHLLTHEYLSKATMYKCDSCPYQSDRKYRFSLHLLTHKNPSLTISKCTSCSYQTISKSSLKAHLLVHKDRSCLAMYNCESCSFQTKYKYNLRQHISMKHKNDPK